VPGIFKSLGNKVAALERAHQFVPAYVLGIKCAFAVQDIDWALANTLQAIKHAKDTQPFDEIFVLLKNEKGGFDSNVTSSLERLYRKDSENQQWKEMLGNAYYQTGRSKDALKLLNSVIKKGNTSIKNYVWAAESAFFTGKTEEAIKILETAYQKYPGNPAILNDLIYLLAEKPATAPHAATLLPRLLKIPGTSSSPTILDTAGYACLKNGKLTEAEKYLTQAMALVDNKNPQWLLISLHNAELNYFQDRLPKAQADLLMILSREKRNHELRMKALSLLMKVEDRIKNKKPGK